jgi:DNA-binding transcriptional LysR family regulator
MLSRPTLAQLEALRAIARHRSFSRAARALGVTQPAVSQQIAALQRHLGLRLVDVVRNRPELTEAGRYLAERAELVGRQLEALLRDALEYARAEAGTLRFAATRTIGSYVVPSLLAAFAKRHPNVVPSVSIANTAEVAAAVRDGSAPLGLVEGVVDDAAFECTPFSRDRLVLVVPARGHRLSSRQRVRAAELEDEAFVSREPGSGTRDLGYELVRRMELRTRVAAELPSGEAIVRAVERGMGIAILSQHVVERAVELGTLRSVEIEGLDLERRFLLLRLRGRSLSPLAQAFAELVLHNTGSDDR